MVSTIKAGTFVYEWRKNEPAQKRCYSPALARRSLEMGRGETETEFGADPIQPPHNLTGIVASDQCADIWVDAYEGSLTGP